MLIYIIRQLHPQNLDWVVSSSIFCSLIELSVTVIVSKPWKAWSPVLFLVLKHNPSGVLIPHNSDPFGTTRKWLSWTPSMTNLYLTCEVLICSDSVHFVSVTLRSLAILEIPEKTLDLHTHVMVDLHTCIKCPKLSLQATVQKEDSQLLSPDIENIDIDITQTTRRGGEGKQQNMGVNATLVHLVSIFT